MEFIKQRLVSIGSNSKGVIVPRVIRKILENQSGDYFKITIEKIVEGIKK